MRKRLSLIHIYMDFRFGLNKNKMTTKMYGDMTYWFDYHVKVLSFNVYEGKTEESTVKLFSQNANGHFDPDIMEGLLNPDGGEAELSSTLMSRDYLENSTEFSGDSFVDLYDIDADVYKRQSVGHVAYKH